MSTLPGSTGANERGDVGKEFHTLGAALKCRYLEAKHDELAFPTIAKDCLREARLHEKISGTDVLEWAATDTLPPQFDVKGAFGQPPITVYQDARFHIDVLCWRSSSTSVHQHGFSGAFAVLGGSSVCCDYSFELEERVNSRFLLGKLGFRAASLLGPGDIRPIVGGGDYVHSLFHLEHPSFSVVVRTETDPDRWPQYEYLRNGIAFDPFHNPVQLHRPLDALAALLEAAPERYLGAATQFVQHADPFEVLILFTRHLPQLSSRTEILGALANRVIARHGVHGKRIVDSLAERTRIQVVSELRKRVRDPDHRFLLALLLNVPTRDEILRLIAARAPARPPRDTLERWVGELNEREASGVRLEPPDREPRERLSNG